MWEPAHAWILGASDVMPGKEGQAWSKKIKAGSDLKAEGQGYTILPGQVLQGKLSSVGHLRNLASPRSVGA